MAGLNPREGVTNQEARRGLTLDFCHSSTPLLGVTSSDLSLAVIVSLQKGP